ncbi:MAG TPA: outer membrane beta-barrel protein [Sphingomicrobium sp.]|nr:outer membrane beta-barrel protein [Sphingomicrobium sp.]
MRKYLFAAVAAAAIASPAAAKDNSGYVGLEGGILFPQKQDINAAIDFTDPLVTDAPDGNVGRFKFKKGYDVDLIGGYDFGMFRLEGELGYKRTKNKSFSLDPAFVTALNAGAGTALTSSDFDIGGHASVLSGMVNALLDVGGNGGIGGYAGVGAGYAHVKEFSDSDNSFAWQLLAGVYAPVSNNIDVGLKYRYFSTGNLHFNDAVAFAAGAGPCGPVGAPVPCSGGTASFGVNDKFQSHSLLASLVYNFGGAAVEAAPPPPPPPPPPPEAPATQTCPDGSVILATSACPAPPPPPPPPPATSGERGR